MTTTTAPVVTDKKEAILTATCDLVAERGLHNTPMSAIARKASIAAGTLYLYFQSKDDLLNEVFLHLKRESLAYIEKQIQPAGSLEERLRLIWFALADWHLKYPQAFNVIQQCEVSGILSPHTLQQQEAMEKPLLQEFQQAVEEGLIKDLPREIAYALMMGPIVILAHLQAKGEIDVTEEVLHHTYEQLQQGIRP